jgi:hypothetical protein
MVLDIHAVPVLCDRPHGRGETRSCRHWRRGASGPPASRAIGPNAHGKFRLRNVVHVPGSLCNIVGGPSDDDYAGMQLGGLGDSGKDGQLTGSGGRRLAYVHRSGGFFIIKLSAPPIGPVVGESPFREAGGISSTRSGPSRSVPDGPKPKKLLLQHATRPRRGTGCNGIGAVNSTSSVPTG